MELNRNHFFVLGTILLLIGIQFRFVESFMLNEETSRFIAERLELKNKKQSIARSITPQSFSNLLTVMSPQPRRRIVKPPRWLGWSFVSVGAVLMLHSLAMRKPE